MSDRLVQALRREFGETILATDDHCQDLHVRVAADRLPAVLGYLKTREDCTLLGDVIGIDYPERAQRFEVVYYLRSLSLPRQVWVQVGVAEGEAVPSATGLFRSADWHEREVYDLFGVPFANHPDLRRILCHHEFEGHALRKDYPIEQGQELGEPEKLYSDRDIARAAHRASLARNPAGAGDEIHATDLLTVNLGPSHPAMHGCLRAEVLLDGETIVDARAEIGYLHRCFEKEAEDHTWAQVMPYTDRLNYCSPLLNNVIYALAVEKLLEIEVPPRCKAIRVIVSELSRIIDHLVCVGTNLVDMGALTMYWYTFNVREAMYEIIEHLCGSRLTTNYARIGGLSHDLYPGFEAEVRAKLAMLDEAVTEVVKLAARNRIFLDRTLGIGAISRDDAVSHGFTGPCLRACGVAYDARKLHPHLDYQEYDFDVPTGEDGDTHSRIMVRFAEMIQSKRIIEQALRRLPAGPVNVDDPRVVLPPKEKVYGSIEGVMNQFKLIYEGIRVPAGTAYGFGEGGNGELGFYCVADGSGRPYRMKVRPPCFPVFGAYPRIIRGGMISDAIATLGSLNIIAGELDR
ncbi:MAG TPA: NADH-quinone oxidoreductase subunit D [Candidatus Krumholzibacteria bacterium]|nr:NADH-quinone oxidoreductase subunit D [Candidatus Krumholzibacteria bacterium]HPD71415.1 NADH-quinone oxidoreductase subunit D [Candidatus Krumholzibacteria bacterium]HRY41652.1 NADH-quinone oxidoreductase subunit D [Candidatus Krumholzibacteria bacterium]